MDENANKSVCDKCGKEVPMNNDATLFEALIQLNPSIILLCQPRHLLPTEDCEGSPSRAQYLPGQLRDKRTAYPYDPSKEATYRKAYESMLKEAQEIEEAQKEK